jgi:hypothetical protein
VSLHVDRYLSSRWWYALAATCIAYYAFTVTQLADSTPKFDDLNDVFGFFKQLALAHTPLQKIGAFFYPNNEHITFFSHLVYFTQYQLLGEIRFYPLILTGHLIIVATACLLGTAIDSGRRPFYFATITIGYINLYCWDSSFKAMTAISNQAVLLFAVATFFALLRWHKLWIALVFALFATFSQGNGILVWPLGLLVLLLDTHWQPSRRHCISIWMFTAVGAIAIYGWAHHVYGMPSPARATTIFSLLDKGFTLPILSVFAFLGSTVFSPVHVMLAIAVGAGTAVIFSCCAWRSRNRHTLVLTITGFLLVSAVIASITRGLLTGEASAVLESRYKMYSVAFVLLTLVWLCEQSSKPAQRAALAAILLVVSLGIHASSYRVVWAIQHQAQKFSESYQYWLEDGDFRRQALYFPPMSDHFLFVAEHLQLFNFMQFVPNGAILTPLPAVSARTCPPTPAPADHCPMTIRHRGNALFVVIDGITIDVETLDGNISHPPALPANITLCDEQANAVMEFVIPEHPASQQHWLVPEADIPAGNYRVLFQPAQQPACETQLTKKPRKVKTEMRTLFGD